jgi:hypothetical protein
LAVGAKAGHAMGGHMGVRRDCLMLFKAQQNQMDIARRSIAC